MESPGLSGLPAPSSHFGVLMDNRKMAPVPISRDLILYCVKTANEHELGWLPPLQRCGGVFSSDAPRVGLRQNRLGESIPVLGLSREKEGLAGKSLQSTYPVFRILTVTQSSLQIRGNPI